MITVTPEDIQAYAPEFASTSDERLQLFIDYAWNFVAESKWARKTKMAVVLMTCHLLTRSNQAASGVAGPITAERVGELSRSYANNVNSLNPELSGTSYGQDFLALRKTLLITPIVV